MGIAMRNFWDLNPTQNKKSFTKPNVHHKPSCHMVSKTQCSQQNYRLRKYFKVLPCMFE